MAAPEREDLFMPYKFNYSSRTCMGIVRNPYNKILLKKDIEEDPVITIREGDTVIVRKRRLNKV